MKNYPLLKLQTLKYPKKDVSPIIFMIVALFFAALSRPAFAQGTVSPGTEMQQLRTNLYVVTTSTDLLDATLTQYNSDGNNAVDGKDAKKIPSLSAGTQLGMLRDGKNLIIERRQSIIVNDTIFYNLMTASKRNYRFEFIAVKLDWGVMNVFLEDAYLNISAPVKMNDTTTVDFTVNADAASSAADRFRLVFEAKSFVLPLPFTFNVRAKQQNKDIAVEWIAENETNIKSYDVETSANGLQFENAVTVISNRSTATGDYQWLDANAGHGMHYYRIRSINENDEILISNIVKVVINRGKSKIMVYPNPIVKERINLKFSNQLIGNYAVKLSVKAATVIAKRNNSIENYQWLDANAGKGIHYYRIRSINESDEVLVSNIVKVVTNTGKQEIAVYPNPVVNAKINVKFTNQPKGNYVLKLIDNFGRVAIRKEIHLSERNVIETINAGKNMVNGFYYIEVISPENKVTSIPVILQ